MSSAKNFPETLKIVNNQVISYTTVVAEIENDTLKILGWWSRTTTKHVNLIARTMNLKIVKAY